jgi:hypothetical protein
MTRLSVTACVSVCLAACAARTIAAGPSDERIREEAYRCGLKPDQLVWTLDDKGRRQVLMTPHGDLDSLSARSFMCMLEWGKRAGANISFISEPPPVAEPGL